MQRITRAHVEAQIDIVNRMLGFDPATVTYSTDGALVLSSAYGGYAVHRYSGTGGGREDLSGGHGTLRDASTFLRGMIAALRIVQS